jgi:hypothetical protein
MTRIFYWLASLLLAWLLMQAVHEFGHLLGTWATGGRVTQVVLHPLAISRTDVEPNPSPRIEVWAGPIIGVLVPLAAWFIAQKSNCPLAAWLRFFAGFCLIANGGYLGYGVFTPIGDAEELVRLGTPPWLLGAFGVVCIPCGLRLWHGLGKEFGIGKNVKPISWQTAGAVLVLLIVVVAAEISLSRPG